jgi:hypothetical protein
MPSSKYQRGVQELVTTYLVVHERLERLHAIVGQDHSRYVQDRKSPGLDKVIMQQVMKDLKSVERSCQVLFEAFSGFDPAAKWAMEEAKVPSWVSAGYASGVPHNVDSASHLIAMSGMEARRYVSPEEAKNIMMEYLIKANFTGSRKKYIFNKAEIGEIAERVMRSASDLSEGGDYSWDAVFYWATKRTHFEFLRTVSLKLGEWIEVHPENHYHQHYLKVMQEQNDKIIKEDKNIMLAQVTHRARSYAVRMFLSDYYNNRERYVAA